MKQFLQTKRRAGQITLVALLLGVLGLSIGLSVASRSLADLKQASYVDFGTKALAAAEAGAEFGLYQLSLNVDKDCVSRSALGQFANITTTLGIASIDYTICPDQNLFVAKDVAKDDVLQVDMPSANGNSQIYVLWNPAANNSARGVEISVLYADYSVKRFAFSSAAGSLPGSNFTAALPQYTNVNCPAGYASQNNPLAGVISGTNAIQVRVKPLGGSSKIQVCGNGALGIPPQTYVITSTAKTTNNTARRVQVTKEINGTLPAVFDNVIYSGGDLTK